MELNTSEYDIFVEDMLVSSGNVKDWTIAIAEEVGELCGKVKRLNRGDYKQFEYSEYESSAGNVYPDKFVDDVGKELGDILYYITALSHELDYNLSDIMEGNMEKLRARKAAGTIKGSGDSR